MKNQIFKYLRQYSTEPIEVDRLIISAFLTQNKIIVKQNNFLKQYIIQQIDINEYNSLSKFILILEKEIQLFGFEELM